MLTSALKAQLADDIQRWQTDGLISAPVAAQLRTRYQANHFGLVGVVKYLGICGGVLSLFGLLGLVTAMAGSEGFGGAVTLSVGAGLMAIGLWLCQDLRHRFAVSGRAVTALGALASAAGVAVLAHTMGLGDADIAFVTGCVVVPVFLFLAYRLGDGFMLVLALLCLFHWVGSWTAMWGRSDYVAEIDQPEAMVVVAAAVFTLGLWHARLRGRLAGFHVVYQSVALVYGNLSLLILTIDAHHALAWIGVFTAAALAQIVGGARLHSGLLLGFGVTVAAIDLFTRYYERFWNQLSLGTFLALGGGALLAFGLVFERARRGRIA